MLGGALGATMRYLVCSWVAELKWGEFPWGVLLVNLLGSFLIGVLFVAAQRELPLLTKLAIGVGFLGSLTTFSTFMLDTLLLWKNGHMISAGSYVVSSLVLGLLLVAIGQIVGQWWLGPVST